MSVEMPLDPDRPPLLKGALRYQWPTVVAAVLVCAVLGTVVGLAKGRSYRSTATVLIAPLEGVPYSPESVARQSQANTDALTDARLAATPAVARLVERQLRLPGKSLAWRPNLSVDVVPNSQVVRIGYLSSSARRAREMAHAFSTQYLRYRAIRSEASVSGQLHSLESRARQVQKRLSAETRALASNHTSAHRATLSQQVAIYTDQLAALSVQTAQLAGASRNPGQVLTPASSPVASGVPTAALSLVGVIAGLVLGLALAFVRESGHARLREASEVEEAGVPLLAILSVQSSGPPDAEEIDRYRALRTAVLTHAPAPRVIEISALSPTVLAADVAAGLGTALARAGSETTVILTSPESDPRGRPGLADVLLERADARRLREQVAPGLFLLSPGREIDAAAEMFASEKLRSTLRDLAGDDGYVLVAASAAGTTASTALAVVCDEVVFVSPLEDSSVQDLTRAVAEVQRVRGHALGAVAVEHARRRDPGLGIASPSLPRIMRAWVTRWRAPLPRRAITNADTPTERRLRDLSTSAAALEDRIEQAKSNYARLGSSDARPDGEPPATEEAGAPSARSDDGAVEAAGAVGKPAPAASSTRKRAAPTKGSSARRPKRS